ncbi:hypothetical protein LUZ63_020473 [Rhynchospora breviuscula]|uniref:HTH cro/C1-type domain-containing protein n=1 Tax=Rhynchospora breviuscula TaxID=2022672 RepID=A0A9Q0BZG9_9POAL|nr:hypothetical protein LUZ63_020473 [Rhynchospora breviuscula]
MAATSSPRRGTRAVSSTRTAQATKAPTAADQPPETAPVEASSAAPGVDQASERGARWRRASQAMPPACATHSATRPEAACAGEAPTACNPARTTAKEELKPTRAATTPATSAGVWRSRPVTSGASTGARVQAARTARGWSLSTLATAAGVGKGTLSELESGRRNPTLDTLYAIAGPLGVPLADLVAEEDVEVGDGALTSRRLHVHHEAGRTTEVYLVTVRAGRSRRSPAHAEGAEEQLVVLAGEGVLEHGDEHALLRPGTHHRWRADVAHTYRCTGDDDLVAVDVIVTPTP